MRLTLLCPQVGELSLRGVPHRAVLGRRKLEAWLTGTWTLWISFQDDDLSTDRSVSNLVRPGARFCSGPATVTPWARFGNAEVDQPVPGSRACESPSDPGGQTLTGSRCGAGPRASLTFSFSWRKDIPSCSVSSAVPRGSLLPLVLRFSDSFGPSSPTQGGRQPLAGSLLETGKEFALGVESPLWFLRTSVCQSSWSCIAAQQTHEGVRVAKALSAL